LQAEVVGFFLRLAGRQFESRQIAALNGSTLVIQNRAALESLVGA
jgi:hypothetical protein